MADDFTDPVVLLPEMVGLAVLIIVALLLLKMMTKKPA
jgi:hypothetical protein